jgi:hypothetical protein
MLQQQQIEHVTERLVNRQNHLLFEKPADPLRFFPKNEGAFIASDATTAVVDLDDYTRNGFATYVDLDAWYKPAGVLSIDTIAAATESPASAESAYDRIQIRRLVMHIKKVIGEQVNNLLFEVNDDYTRKGFEAWSEWFLRDLKAKDLISDFRVICDRTNNTEEIVYQNQFVADIYIKPTPSIDFIQLNFIAYRTSVNFGEIVK